MGAGGLANRFGSSPGSSGAAGAGSGACFAWDFVTPGLPDAAFEDAPGFSPTPMELRVMLLAHLRPRADSVVWDVGGGTGALALEIARLMPAGTVHTLERDPEAIDLLQRNRRRFAIENLHIQAGQAPDDLHLLPPIRIGCCWKWGARFRPCSMLSGAPFSLAAGS